MRRESRDETSIRREAAAWIVRLDRGLNPDERLAHETWLAQDERHAAALQRSGAAWTMLGSFESSFPAGERALIARRRSPWRKPTVWSGLAAAAIVLLLLAVAPLRKDSGSESPTEDSRPAPEWIQPRIVTLSDETVVRLNADAEVQEQFTPEARRVHLLRGEAHFTVTRQTTPFIVHAHGVEARAVGTAYNVKLHSGSVEILVTEGTVAVSGGRLAAGSGTESLYPLFSHNTDDADSPPPPEPVSGPLLLTASQRAVVSLQEQFDPGPVAVETLTAAEIARALAWQEPLLRLRGATLAELATEFQRRTGYRIQLDDPEISSLRIGGRFRGDDVDGFLRVLSMNYDLTAETLDEKTILLRRAPPSGYD